MQVDFCTALEQVSLYRWPPNQPLLRALSVVGRLMAGGAGVRRITMSGLNGPTFGVRRIHGDSPNFNHVLLFANMHMHLYITMYTYRRVQHFH